MRILLILFIFLISCQPKSGYIRVGAEAVGDMPPEAANVDRFELIIRNVTDVTNHDPRTTVGAGDTLHVWFNYKEPDNLPVGVLPSTVQHSLTVQNTDELWDVDNDANLVWKDWVTLEAGAWQFHVKAINDYGEALSGRYDFLVTGTAPIKVIIHGL